MARLVERLPPANGGKEVHAAQLSMALREVGVEQHVFAREGDRLGAGIVQSAIRQGRASPVHRLVSYCIGASRAIERAHRIRPFDVIHAHGDFLEALAAASTSRRLGVPALLTVHGGLSDVRWHDELRVAAFSAMDQVIAVSHPVAAALEEIGVSSRVQVAPSGVREEFFLVSRQAPSDPLIVTVGRLAPVKGLETLLAAYDLLADKPWRWMVFAGGEGTYADSIRREIERRSRISCVEERDPARLAATLADASAFVLPSVEMTSQHEGVPTALLEAIAVGVPVIASDTGGVSDVLAGGAGGRLVAPADAAATAAAIVATLAEPEASVARAERARESGAARPWSAVAADVLRLYEAARGRAGSRSALLAVPWFDIGGAEKFVLTVARGLESRGLRTAIAGAPGRLVAEIDEGIEYVPLRRLDSFGDAVHNVCALAGAAARLRPEAVNSHHVPIGVLARAGASLARVRTRHLLTLHLTEDPRMAPVVGVAGSFVFDGVLCVAQAVRHEFVRWAAPWRRSRFRVARYGVEIPAEVEKPGSLVGCVARLVGRKGHPVLVEAWAHVASDPRASGWQLELWGEGPDRGLIEELIVDAPSIRLIGPVKDASDRVGGFDIVVLPSFREGLPITLLEAMAARCAVVASDLPGCREVVGSDAGVLVPSGDALALAGALVELIADTELRERLAAEGQKRVRELFSREQMIDAYYRAVTGDAA